MSPRCTPETLVSPRQIPVVTQASWRNYSNPDTPPACVWHLYLRWVGCTLIENYTPKYHPDQFFLLYAGVHPIRDYGHPGYLHDTPNTHPAKKIGCTLLTLEKSVLPLFELKKVFAQPYFFLIKTLSPPFYFLPKPAPNTVLKTTWCIYCTYYSYSNEQTRVTIDPTFSPYFSLEKKSSHTFFLKKKTVRPLFFFKKKSPPP